MTHRVIIQPQAERAIQKGARWVFVQSKSRPTTLRWVRMIRAKIETVSDGELGRNYHGQEGATRDTPVARSRRLKRSQPLEKSL